MGIPLRDFGRTGAKVSASVAAGTTWAIPTTKASRGMTKVCTHGRDKAVAMKMLEESLRRPD